MGALSLPPSDDDDGRRRKFGGPERLSSKDASGRGDDPTRFVVPDDLSGLEDEVRTVQSELGIDPRCWERGWTGRRARLVDRLRGGPRHRGWAGSAVPPAPSLAVRPLLVGPILACILLLVAGLVALFPPSVNSSSRRLPAPRLAAPVQPPGTVGGLLPDVLLESPRGVVAARSLRPAVLLLVPDGCGCPALINQAVAQVTEFPGLEAALVTTGRDPATSQLAADTGSGRSRLSTLIDRDAVLAQAYHVGTTAAPAGASPAGTAGPTGTVAAPTLLLVAADGVLSEPPVVFSDGLRIEGGLLPLVPRAA